MKRGILKLRFLVGTAAILAPFLQLRPSDFASRSFSASAAKQVDARMEQSLRAFAAVASVLTSPRCLNCHVPGDSPLQGDEETPHNMNVKRGPGGKGTVAMRCSNCHQEVNSSALHAPPGAPGWRLPPPSMKMAWQGLSVGEICRTLKNPDKNGGRSLDQLEEHIRNDRIVNWAWNPGPDRSLPPLTHEEFVERFTEWVQTGASCAP